MTDTTLNKLMGITAAELLVRLLTVDGHTSGLDADLLDGQEGAYYRNASNLNAGAIPAAVMPAFTGDITTVAGSLATTLGNGVVTLAKMANLAANSVIANNTGSAAAPTAVALSSLNVGTATKLQTARSIALTGVVTGSASFDGSANASLTTAMSTNHGSTALSFTGSYDLNTEQPVGYVTAFNGTTASGGPGGLGTSSYFMQIARGNIPNRSAQLIADENNNWYLRTSNASSAWNSWRKVWHDGNLTIANYATLASPAFTGTPTAPTATAGTNTTQVATTQFVATAVAAIAKGMSWTTVSADVNPAVTATGYMVQTGGTLKQVTLPAAAPAGFYTEIFAHGGQVRVVMNGNTLTGVTTGDNLLLEPGGSIYLVARATGAFEIVGYQVPGTAGTGGNVPAQTAGAVFPSAPVDGQIFRRTDRMIEYFWHGTAGLWLSTQEFPMGGDSSGVVGNSTSGAILKRMPVRGDYSQYITKVVLSTFVQTTNSLTAYWSVNLDRFSGGNVQTTIQSTTTITGGVADTPNNWYTHDITVNAVLDPTARECAITATKTSTPGALFWSVETYYRLIG